MKRAVSSIGVFAPFSFGTAVSAFDNVTPVEPYDAVLNDPVTFILDVRTAAEWTWVGHPGEYRSGVGAGLTDKVVTISVKVNS